MAEKIFSLIENYIYLHHLEKYIILPSFPQSVADNMQVTFASQTPLARTAPIYSYSYSGPRSLNVQIELHRDMFNQVNTNNKSIKDLDIPENEDYVDAMIRYLEACALPKYSAASKMIDPPIVSVRFGDDIFIKGVIIGEVGVTYQTPIITNSLGQGSKYALVSIHFNIHEIQPFDAESVVNAGSMRGLNTTLERGDWNIIK